MKILRRGSSGIVKVTRSLGRAGYTFGKRPELIVLWKEIVDSFRDRRTIVNVLLLPLILMPVAFALPFFFISPKTNPPNVVVVVRDLNATKLVSMLMRDLPKVSFEKNIDPNKTILQNKADLVVIIPRGFSLNISRGGQSNVFYYYDPYNMKSSTAITMVSSIVERYQSRIVSDRLKELNLTESYVRPIKEVSKEVVSKGVSLASPTSVISVMLLPIFIGVIAMTGASAFALDMIAGERERKTMEALFTNPVSGTSILVGKYLAMTAIAFLSAIVTLASALASLLLMNLLFTSALGPLHRQENLNLTIIIPAAKALPLVLAGIFLAVVLAALTGNSIIAVVASFAKSFKEAQQYMGFVTMVLMLLIVAVPYMPPSMMNYLACVPVASIMVFVRDLLVNPSNLMPIAMSLVFSVIYLVMLLYVSGKVFSRESLISS